jgi:hypothetical protein
MNNLPGPPNSTTRTQDSHNQITIGSIKGKELENISFSLSGICVTTNSAAKNQFNQQNSSTPPNCPTSWTSAALLKLYFCVEFKMVEQFRDDLSLALAVLL